MGLLILPEILIAQVSTIGREFYVGFMDNNRRETQPDRVVVILTAMEQASGTIQTPKQNITFDLNAGEQLIQEFDGDGEGLIHRGSGAVDFKPFSITSSGDLTVHAINGREYSSDGTVILPVTALSSEYLVMAHFDVFSPDLEPGSNQNYESTLLVVAIENNTEVEVIPSATTVNTIPAGAPINFTLNAGESYQIKALGDLSGSSVRVLNQSNDSCKLLAVFGGNKTSSAGDCGTSGDHIYQQAYPLGSWGKEYIHVPLAGRTSGEIVKVLASEDNTQVEVNGSLEATLGAGEFKRFEFAKDEIASIKTSKPSSVAVVAKSAACNEFGVAPLGDPSMFLLSPNQQKIEDITFSTGKLIGEFNQDIEHYLSVVVETEFVDETILNGQNIGSQFQPALSTGYSYARIEVPFGVNRLSNPNGLIGYVYGSGSIESYGFSVGTSLDKIQFETEVSYDFDVDGDKVACLDQEGSWAIFPENEDFNIFAWDFGDGSEIIEGERVQHVYSKTGKFEVNVFASTGEGRCDTEEKFTFEVEVKEVKGVISGPKTVCPDDGPISYEISDKINFERAVWEIQGGVFMAQTDSTLTVDWSTEGNGFIEAVLLTDEGCEGEMITLEVEVTSDISPALAEGPSGICDATFQNINYKVPFPNADREYSWNIQGGTIVSGQNTEQILVDWDENSLVKEVYYTETSTSSASCSGDSDVLTVEIYSPVIVIPNSFDPSCSGDQDGIIEISISGGSGSFEYFWSHDESLGQGLATGLSPGFYSVEIRDATGCYSEVFDFSLTDPTSISSISSPQVTAPTCFGGFDGEVIIELSGGSGNFKAPDYASSWDGTYLTVFDIPAGDFVILVSDENDCGLSVSGVMPAADPIILEFIEGSPSCPNSNDGELSVVVSGGSPPYTILWEDGQTDPKATNLPSGIFSVTVTDANGCIQDASGEVAPGSPQVRLPTGFNPNDGLYKPIIVCNAEYYLMIWNRWGQLVYAGADGWDGTTSGDQASLGVYSYRLEYSYQEGGSNYEEVIKGTFTLVR